MRIRAYLGPVLLSCTLGCAVDRSHGSDGWQSLFNGRDLSGWQVKCKPEDAHHQFWKVDSNTILADSMGCSDHDYVWLATEHEYADFVFRLKFQAYRDSPGNSGVQVRSRYDDSAGYLDGPQVDINPPGPWRTGMIWDETRGNQRWLFPDVPKGEWVDPSMAVEGLTFIYSKEDDGWNHLEITAVGTQLRAVLNGIEVMNYDGHGVLDDAVHREHGVGTEGVIALQIHTGDQLRIRFKDIYVKRL